MGNYYYPYNRIPPPRPASPPFPLILLFSVVILFLGISWYLSSLAGSDQECSCSETAEQPGLINWFLVAAPMILVCAVKCLSSIDNQKGYSNYPVGYWSPYMYNPPYWKGMKTCYDRPPPRGGCMSSLVVAAFIGFLIFLVQLRSFLPKGFEFVAYTLGRRR